MTFSIGYNVKQKYNKDQVLLYNDIVYDITHDDKDLFFYGFNNPSRFHYEDGDGDGFIIKGIKHRYSENFNIDIFSILGKDINVFVKLYEDNMKNVTSFDKIKKKIDDEKRRQNSIFNNYEKELSELKINIEKIFNEELYKLQSKYSSAILGQNSHELRDFSCKFSDIYSENKKRCNLY